MSIDHGSDGLRFLLRLSDQLNACDDAGPLLDSALTLIEAHVGAARATWLEPSHPVQVGSPEAQDPHSGHGRPWADTPMQWRVPVIHEDTYQAVLSIEFFEPRTLSDTQGWLLAESARRVWAALRRTHRHDPLRRSERRCRGLLSAASAGFAVMDQEGRVVDGNEAFARLVGHDLAVLQQHTLCTLLHPEDLDAYRTQMQRLRSGEIDRFEFEGRYVRRDGEAVWVHQTVSALRDQTGAPQEIVLLAYDISGHRLTAQTLQRKIEELERLMDLVPVAVWQAHDPACDKVTGNRAANELYEALNAENVSSGSPTAPEFRGPRAFYTREGRMLASNELPLQRAMALNQTVRDQEVVVHLPSGRRVTILGSAAPLRDEAGQVRGGLAAFLDTTELYAERDRLEASETSFRVLADNLPALAWMADPDGWLFWYNQRWYDYTGTTPQEMQGWGWERVHDPAHLPVVKARWQASLRSGHPFEMTFPLRGVDGSFRPFLTRIVPLRNQAGRIVRWFGTSTDVTPEREVQSRLEASEAALREADQRKDRFLATLSHELRNPLAPIRTAATLLTTPTLPRDKMAWASQVIQRQVGHMALLLDDLLDVSRISLGKVHLRPQRVALRGVIETALEAARPLIEQKRHTLHTHLPDEPLCLMADPLRLSQIFSNLLGNAAKYTPPGGEISLSAGVQGEWILVDVQDNGIGLPDAALESVFSMFSQLHDEALPREGGLGIGLAICRGLVELHGGRIEASSPGPGQGSRFLVRLPARLLCEAQADAAPAATPPEPAGADAPLKVLIADDNVDAAESLAVFVELEGHETGVAHGGQAALSMADALQPDIAFIDIGMPDLDGLAVARTLRTRLGERTPMLIALTGWGQEEDKRQSAEAGFDAHMTKPIDPEAVSALLNQCAARRTSQPA